MDRSGSGAASAEDLMLAEVPLEEEVVLVRMDVATEDLEALLERGIVPGCKVCPIRHSPGGGPTVYRIDGNLVALRQETASCLCVRSALEAAGVLDPN
ncbi:MAG: FeoA family protein [Longimicrobiales bacterium]